MTDAEGLRAPAPSTRAPDLHTAAALLAVDPHGLGGAVIRASPGPERDGWLKQLRGLLPEATPWRRMPATTPEARLLGGLDLAATLAAGRPVAERGLLAETNDGVLTLPMAERTPPGTAALLAAALDTGGIGVERDGLAMRHDARIALLALDEGLTPEEAVPAPLIDRLAFRLAPQDAEAAAIANPGDPRRAAAEASPPPPDRAAIAAARRRLSAVAVPEAAAATLTTVAHALGIASLRAPLLALRAARAAAALAGRDTVAEDDLSLAARLVLAPRAIRLPQAPEDAPPEPPPTEDEAEAPPDTQTDPTEAQALADQVLAAAAAAIPPNLLASLGAAPARAAPAGRAGAALKTPNRGRAIGSRRGDPRGGPRLALLDTLRAAAPWQRLRNRTGTRIEVRRDDFRVTRFKARTGTTAIFVVDASGSAAIARLAEAKGAVELLLADCYVRRDRVAVIAFRSRAAELLLPPTNSLVRAKRSLAGLPGGGGTPLAAAIDAAHGLADQLKRAGQAPLVVFLTDGRANVARDGTGDRARATGDALAAARLLHAARTPAILLDTSPRPAEPARALAAALGARYLPLPYADPRAVAAVVRSAPGPNSGR